MIKLLCCLLAVTFVTAQMAYTPVQNFDIYSIINKPLYINAVLSKTNLNFTLDNWYPYCAGYMFSSLGSGKIMSQHVLLSNYSSYTSTFTTSFGAESSWTSESALPVSQWSSHGSHMSFNSLTWIYADLNNDYYAVVLSGPEGDIVLILSAYWQTRYLTLAKITQGVIRAGYTPSHFGYYFTQCSGYSLGK